MISRNYVFLVQKNDESFCPMPWLEPQFWKIEMKDLLFFFCGSSITLPETNDLPPNNGG